MNYVILALGSNSGNRLLNLQVAVKLLPIQVKKYSYIYESKALLPAFFFEAWNKKFLNMVISGFTNFNPYEFLRIIKNIESRLGRNNKRIWSPRTIDIDIIFWNNLILRSKNLKIPHSQIQHRDFVLVPLCDINPRIVHPILKLRVEELLLNIDINNLILKYKYLF